jgi:hypothetical protein
MGAKLGRVDFVTNGTIINYMKADSAEMNLTTSIDFSLTIKPWASYPIALTASYSLDFSTIPTTTATKWRLST